MADDSAGADEGSGARLGTYLGRSPDYSCPGDHVSWEIVLLEGGRCTIDCRSELSPSKGGTQAWHIEGSWEWEEDDEEVVVTVTKEDPLGGPRRDRDISLEVAEDRSFLSFKGTRCAWASPPPDPFEEELAAFSLKELKAKAEASGLDPAGCVEREEFLGLLRRAKASGALKVEKKPEKAAPAVPAAPAPAEPVPREEVVAEASAPAAPAAAAEAVKPAPAASAEAETAAAAPAAEEATGTFYTLEQLTDKKVWEKLDVVSTERETYLPDSVFAELFGMPKADFAKLPKWKKENAKKKHGLF